MPVLVIGPSWVGDMVMAQSLFMTLQQATPGLAIDVLAPAWCQGLLARMPQVHQVFTLPVKHGRLGLGARIHMAQSLVRVGYDKAYLLPNSWKSGLVPLLARIPRRIGYVGEWRWGLLTEARRLDQARWPRLVDRFAALGRPEGEAGLPPLPRLAPLPAEAVMARLGLEPGDGPLLVLCPGAEFGPAKQWPIHHFRAVALAWPHRVWILGGPGDQATGQAICQGLEQVVNLAGRTTLAEAVDLMALAHAVVSNDSGLMHVAAALDRPLVALFGSSDPRFTPPLSARARVVALDMACRPCFKRRCPLGHLACLQEITPSQVLDQLESLM